MSDMPWYQKFADADYLRIYSPLLPPGRRTRGRQYRQIVTTRPQSSILDLCCGHGRHTIPLAQQGYHIDRTRSEPIFPATCSSRRRSKKHPHTLGQAICAISPSLTNLTQ